MFLEYIFLIDIYIRLVDTDYQNSFLHQICLGNHHLCHIETLILALTLTLAGSVIIHAGGLSLGKPFFQFRKKFSIKEIININF